MPPADKILVTAAQHINFSFPRKRNLGTPKTLSKERPENSRKFRVSYLKNLEMSRKRSIQGIPANSFWGSQKGILGSDDIPWQMRIAKVDMLGTGDI